MICVRGQKGSGGRGLLQMEETLKLITRLNWHHAAQASCTRFTAIRSGRSTVAGRIAPSGAHALLRSPISKLRSTHVRFSLDVQ